MPITPKAASKLNRELASLAPVIPVLIVEDAGKAADLARALVAGGLPALEVTLRTPAALDVIREMAGVEGGIVGAGTLITPDDVKRAKAAGAAFGVSPGATDRLLDAAEEEELPILAGAASASEAMRLYERGYDFMKFFPAEASGGAKALKALASPCRRSLFAQPAGSPSPMRMIIFRSRMCFAPAAPGLRRLTRSPRVTGRALKRLRGRRRLCPAAENERLGKRRQRGGAAEGDQPARIVHR